MPRLKLCKHRVIISKIKCPKFEIFSKLLAQIFQPAKLAPKCHFWTWDLLNLLNFLTQMPDCDSHSSALLDFFLSSDASHYSTTAYSTIHVVSVSIKLLSNLQWVAPFHCLAYDYYCADWDNHLRDVVWKNLFKLSASATVSEFFEWDQVGIDVFIPNRKYQKILGCCPAGPVLPHGEKLSL